MPLVRFLTETALDHSPRLGADGVTLKTPRQIFAAGTVAGLTPELTRQALEGGAILLPFDEGGPEHRELAAAEAHRATDKARREKSTKGAGLVEA